MHSKYGYNLKNELCQYIEVDTNTLEGINDWLDSHETLTAQIDYEGGTYSLRGHYNQYSLNHSASDKVTCTFPHVLLVINYETNQLDLEKATLPIRRCNPKIQTFLYKHLPAHLQKISKRFFKLACLVDSKSKPNLEVTESLTHLRRAKDCAITSVFYKDDF